MEKTIAAISTPMGTGGVGMVRLSGEGAFAVAGRVFLANSGKALESLPGYRGTLGKIVDQGSPVDEAVAFVYRGPRSYTGEDVVEISCHGGMQAVQTVLRLCLDHGAVLAGPGEFTRRAFQNGKMDLSQAEAVMDLISAKGEAGLRAAAGAREGVLSRSVGAIVGRLVGFAGNLAAWADYPEEDLEVAAGPGEGGQGALLVGIRSVLEEMDRLLHGYRQGRLLREGIPTVLIGKPNVGKSTLMNLLAGWQRSIVTEIPGTTRDVIEDEVRLGDYVLLLSDTAGLRETDNPVERIGVERARDKLAAAQLVLAVFDGSDPLDQEDRELLELVKGRAVIGVVNKTDLPQRLEEEELACLGRVISISARKGTGREALEQAVLELLQLEEGFDSGAPVVANERQRQCVVRARAALEEAAQALEASVTLDAVSVCIDEALEALLCLTGERVSDRVVEDVFSRFCVGK